MVCRKNFLPQHFVIPNRRDSQKKKKKIIRFQANFNNSVIESSVKAGFRKIWLKSHVTTGIKKSDQTNVYKHCAHVCVQRILCSVVSFLLHSQHLKILASDCKTEPSMRTWQLLLLLLLLLRNQSDKKQNLFSTNKQTEQQQKKLK